MPDSDPTARHDPQSLLPLSAAVFSILVALADGEKHGYAIMQAVATETKGAVRMGPGTLYGTLDRMLRAQLVTESAGPGDSTPHSERRRYYGLTGFGGRVLRAEVERLERAMAVARRKKLTLASRRALPFIVAQTSQSAVARCFQPAARVVWANHWTFRALPIGNRRYSRFGNLRYSERTGPAVALAIRSLRVLGGECGPLGSFCAFNPSFQTQPG